MEIIKKNDWSLEIDLNGGRIRELKYGDQLVLGTFVRIDNKEANTHICCPNFGNEGVNKLGLPFHGPFRNLFWSVVGKNENKLEIEVIDLDLKVRQIFDLDKIFSHKVIVQNLSSENRRVNIAVHNYWDSSFGWEGTKLNGQVIDKLIMSDVGEKIEEENKVEVKGKRRYQWSLEGFKYAQFWTGFNNKEEGVKEYDQKYFCLEPSLEKQGFLDGEIFNLGMGEEIKVRQMIKII